MSSRLSRDGGYRFTVKVGKPKDAERAAEIGTSAGKRAAFYVRDVWRTHFRMSTYAQRAWRSAWACGYWPLSLKVGEGEFICRRTLKLRLSHAKPSQRGSPIVRCQRNIAIFSHPYMA